MPGYRGRMTLGSLVPPAAAPPINPQAGFGIRVTATGIEATMKRMQSIALALEAETDRIMREESETAVRKLKALWPVKTGLSRSMWRINRLSALTYRIENPVWYVPFVHYKGTPRDEVLIQNEVPPVIAAMRARVAARLRELVARLSGAGRGGFRGRQVFGGPSLQPPPARAVGG